MDETPYGRVRVRGVVKRFAWVADYAWVSLARTRCPHCSAAVAEHAQWCSLCYADLRPRRVGEGAVGERPGPGEAPVPHRPAPRDELPPGEQLLPDQQVEVLLAGLAAQSRVSVPGVLARPGARVALMVGGTVVAMALAFALLTVLGVALG